MKEKPCVVYVEDDPPSRVLVQAVLSREFEIHTASNGLEGLDMIRLRQPDLVLTDINLPDLNGELIAARIRSIMGRAIPIVAVTSDNSRETRHRAIAAGCTGFLTKPIDGLHFAATVREYLNGRVDDISEGDRKRATGSIQADLTARLESTVRQLQDDNAALRNIDRAKSSFTVQVSHELRTPLTVLNGYVQMLNQMLVPGRPIDASHTQLAGKLIESTKRLQTVVNEIVLMLRVASDSFELRIAPTTMVDFAAEAIREYDSALVQRQLTLNRIGAGWKDAVLGDSVMLRIAISNLLSNAIKATPNGGQITLNGYREDDRLHIVVADTGVGIAPDDLRLLFKPFYTAIDVSRGKTSKTDFRGMGLGMGLTLTTRIVEAHKGRIWAESTGLDEQKLPGSKFHVVLPLAENRMG